MPAPRLTRKGSPALVAPTVWTTLRLTLHADGRTEAELVGGTPFPRHWVYGHDGELVQKTATISFQEWYERRPGTVGTPWGEEDSPVFVTMAETSLEREMSRTLMREGKPWVRSFEPGDVVTEQGEPVEGLFVVLDGMLSVEVDGREVGDLGPGAVIGERAALEGGTRTATLRAITPVKAAVVDPSRGLRGRAPRPDRGPPPRGRLTGQNPSMGNAPVVDCDQHLYESRDLWRRHIDPADRDQALAHRGRRARLRVGHLAGPSAAAGRRAAARATPPPLGRPPRAAARGEPAALRLRRRAPRATTGTRPPGSTGSTRWASTARCSSRTSGCCGSGALGDDLPALTANMAAWNRWCATVVAEGAGRLSPGRPPHAARPRLARCASSRRSSAAGVRLAMIAPALVDGRPLSHPDHDRIWSAFVEHGITPVFHVADQPRPVRRRVVHRPVRSVRERARLGVPLDAAGGRRAPTSSSTACSIAIPTCASASSS